MSASSANDATKNAASATPCSNRIAHQRAQGGGERDQQHADAGEHCSEDHQRDPAPAVGQPAGEGPAHQRGHAEGAEGQPRARLVGPDRTGRVERQRVYRDTDGREVGQVRHAQQHEGACQQASSNWTPDQPITTSTRWNSLSSK